MVCVVVIIWNEFFRFGPLSRIEEIFDWSDGEVVWNGNKINDNDGKWSEVMMNWWLIGVEWWQNDNDGMVDWLELTEWSDDKMVVVEWLIENSGNLIYRS